MDTKVHLVKKIAAATFLLVIVSIVSVIFFVYTLSQGINGILSAFAPISVTSVSFMSTDWLNVLNSVSSKNNLNIQINYSGIYSNNTAVTWHPNATCSGTGISLRNYCLVGRCRFPVNLEADKIGLMSMSVKVVQNGETKCKSAGVWLRNNSSSTLTATKAINQANLDISENNLLTRCQNKEALLYFDYNQDCKIDASDIQAVTNSVLSGGRTPYCFDINSDGRIDATDSQTAINATLGTIPKKICELKLKFVQSSYKDEIINDEYVSGQRCEVPSPGNIDNNEISFYTPAGNGSFSYCGGWISTYNFSSQNPLIYPNKYLFNNFLGYGPAQTGINFKVKNIAYDLWMASPAYWGESFKDEDIVYDVSMSAGGLGRYGLSAGQLQKTGKSFTACGYSLGINGVVDMSKRTSTTYPVYRLTDTKDVSAYFNTNNIPSIRGAFFTVTTVGGADQIKMLQGQYGLYSTITFNPL
ncbi:MAG: dockerin type I domain-containing protein [Candidatus Buchananbacteria bacterium]